MTAKILLPLLGMHRSGTSLAARAFAMAGFPLGNRLATSARHDNPDGYWEDEDIVKAHEDFLTTRFGAPERLWDIESLDDFFQSSCPIAAREKLATELRDLLADRFKAGRLFAFKDPRTARMLPVWKDVASTLAVSLAPVLLLRHPAAVAASLERRNGVEPVVGELMWLRTIRDILHEVDEQLAAIIVHERWFDAPATNKDVLDALASRFELDRRPHWDVPIREEYRGKDLGRAHLALAEEVYSALAAPNGLESRRDILKMIDNQVAPFESFLAFGREQSRRRLPETSPLPFPREGAAESSGTDAATAELVNGNRWCLENRHGYQLHANKRGFPAASLRWHLVQGKPGQRFTVRVRPTSQQGPQLDLHAEIRLETANEIYRSTTTRIDAGVFQKIELDLPPNERCSISLAIAIADEIDHAHNAGLIVVRPSVADP